jgi:hypothetical protein
VELFQKLRFCRVRCFFFHLVPVSHKLRGSTQDVKTVCIFGIFSVKSRDIFVNSDGHFDNLYHVTFMFKPDHVTHP